RPPPGSTRSSRRSARSRSAARAAPHRPPAGSAARSPSPDRRRGAATYTPRTGERRAWLAPAGFTFRASVGALRLRAVPRRIGGTLSLGPEPRRAIVQAFGELA